MGPELGIGTKTFRKGVPGLRNILWDAGGCWSVGGSAQAWSVPTPKGVELHPAGVGSVREVVARALRDFRLAGLVATAPDSVLILDPTRLHDESWSKAAE